MVKIFYLVREKGKDLFDRIKNERLKNNILQAIPFWVASILTGLVAVLYARLFLWAEKGAIWIYHGTRAFFFSFPQYVFGSRGGW